MNIRAYVGTDYISRLTERVLKEFQLYIAEVYGIKVDIDITELPLVNGEGEGEIPLVMINDRVIAIGEPPSFSKLLDEVFQNIEMEYSRTIMGFPILYESIEPLTSTSP